MRAERFVDNAKYQVAMNSQSLKLLFRIFVPLFCCLLSASVEDLTRPPVVGRLRSSPVLS